MHIEPILVVGAGGHAKVVVDALRAANAQVEIVVRDDDSSKQGQSLLHNIGISIPVGELESWPENVHIAVGDNRARMQIGQRAMRGKKRFYTVVHPRACVSASSRVAAGVFIAAQAVVGPEATIGVGSIVNHAAIIDHDCIVGDWCHIAPGAVLGGGVYVGESCLVGSGAVVLPGVVLGPHCVVGSGAVVTHNVADHHTVVGIPARPLVGQHGRGAKE